MSGSGGKKLSRLKSFRKSFRWRNKKAKPEAETVNSFPINNFGNMLAGFKAATKLTKDNTMVVARTSYFDFTKIHQNPVKLLEDIYVALNRSSFIGASSNYSDRISHLTDILQYLNAYRATLDVASARIDLLKPFIAEQIAAIDNIGSNGRGGKHNLIRYEDVYFEHAIAAIKIITKPQFIALLKLINQFKDTDSTPQGQDLNPAFNDFAVALGFDLDMLTADLTTLLPPPLPLSRPIGTPVSERLAKISAKRALNLNNRTAAEVNTVIAFRDIDFTNSNTPKVVKDAICALITRLPQSTRTISKQAQGQYDNIPALNNLNKAKKAESYMSGTENIFGTRTTADSDNLVVVDLVNKKDVLDIKFDQNTNKTLRHASVTVPGNVSDDFKTQIILVDTLSEIAKTLGAVSVQISSVDPVTRVVNVDNILKNAYNALHANIAPKFDNATWAALQNYVTKAVNFTNPAVPEAEDIAYLKRYRSKQFVQFLLKINPNTNAPKTYSQVYSGFTDVQIDLGINPEYILRRPRKRS